MIVDNLVHFARVLRRAGLQVGPDRVLSAIAAVQAVGVERREDLRAALSAVMLDRHEQQAIFDAAFDAFFRDPKLLERLMYLMLPKVAGRGEKERAAQAQRLTEALSAPREKAPRPPAPDAGHDEVPFETTFSFSERERLQRADFESMTTAEYALARALAERLPPPVQPVRRRRHEANAGGTAIDLRRTLQRMARHPFALEPVRTRARRELPPLVVLLDISGSMDRYARLFLHYVHGLVRQHVRVQVFTFGTRLTNVSRALRHRDP
ncbi:MAG: vWA domain-containing protein, partial [Rubrivivax sp.]